MAMFSKSRGTTSRPRHHPHYHYYYIITIMTMIVIYYYYCCYYYYYYYYYIIIIIIIIELTHNQTILENTVEIEPQPVALDFKNLSQYSSRSK